MKRDLLFVTEHLAAALDERRLAIIFRLHGIGKTSGAGDAPAKLLASFLRKADESTLAGYWCNHRPAISAQFQRVSESPARSRRVLQGGRGRDHGQDQAGVRGQGKDAATRKDAAKQSQTNRAPLPQRRPRLRRVESETVKQMRGPAVSDPIFIADARPPAQ